MHEDDVVVLLEKVVTADRIFWEQQLGSKWVCPPVFESLLKEKKEAKMKDDPDEWRAVKQNLEPSVTSLSQDEYSTLLSSPQTNAILDLLVAETANFLIEEKTLKLITSLKPEEQKLMKVDSIFKALGIKTLKEVDVLEEFFTVAGNEETNEPDTLIDPTEVTHSLRIYLENRQKGNFSAPDDIKGVSPDSNTIDEADEDAVVEVQDRLASWKRLKEAINPNNFKVWSVNNNVFQSDLIIVDFENSAGFIQ